MGMIAEGTELNELYDYLNTLPAGTPFEIQIFMDRVVEESELTETYVLLSEQGLYPTELYQDNQLVIHIKLVTPEGIGLLNIPLLIAATIAVGFIGWRLTSPEAMEQFTSQLIPIVIIGGLVFLVFAWMNQEEGGY